MKVLFSDSFKFFDGTKKLTRNLESAGLMYLTKICFRNLSFQEIKKIKEIKKRNGLRPEEF